MSNALQIQHQKILRGLMRDPVNKKCADCGEQCAINVDTTHGIFVCTNCSGIHREFGNRIKSVSMAVFIQEDIKLLQQQTNDSFNQIWMAKWKSETPLPLNANDSKRRTFLTAKYQEKRWYSHRVAAIETQCPTRLSAVPVAPPPIALSSSAAPVLPPLPLQPKQPDLVDDLLDFGSPSSPPEATPTQMRTSLLQLIGLMADSSVTPLPTFPPTTNVLRSHLVYGAAPRGSAFQSVNVCFPPLLMTLKPTQCLEPSNPVEMTSHQAIASKMQDLIDF
jgi:hypothetical protein